MPSGWPEQLEARALAHEHGGVERAAAQVVDRDPVALGHPVPRRRTRSPRPRVRCGCWSRSRAGPPSSIAWPSRSRLNGPQLAGCVTQTCSGGPPCRSVAIPTTHASNRAVSACAEYGEPPTISGTGSPMRRLNSRTSRAGSAAPCCSAASPTTNSPSSRTNTTDGTCIARMPEPEHLGAAVDVHRGRRVRRTEIDTQPVAHSGPFCAPTVDRP